MTLNQELLTEIVPIVVKKLEAWSVEIGQIDQVGYSAWSARRRAADDRIVEFFTTRYDARFTDKGSDHAVTMAGIRATSTRGWNGALQNWRRAAENKLTCGAGRVHRPSPYSTEAGLFGGLGRREMGSPSSFTEETCPGHVASAIDPKVCARCGVHVDSFRPDDDDGFNLQGSGPAPIEPREG